jgi:putative DNA primase/helicase
VKPDDALSRAIERINLVDLLNAYCPTPETARLNPVRGGLIRDPRPGREEHHPSFSISRSSGTWLWHRFGRADERGREEGGNAYHLLISLGWNPKEAANELVRFVEGNSPSTPRLPARISVQRVAAHLASKQMLEALERAQHELERRWPIAELEARGLTLIRSQRCGLGITGDGAILIPIWNPSGTLTTVKQRYPEGSRSGRYSYLSAGSGAPAWCNPDYGQAKTVLLCEGELNAIVAWSAAQTIGLELDVQGIAGANASPHPEGLKGRAVFVYADGDSAGRAAIERWTAFARETGALEVVMLEPLPMPFDFCDVAGTEGFEALGERLRDLIRHARSSPPVPDSAPDPDSTPEPGVRNTPSSTLPFVPRPRRTPAPCSSS